MLNIVITPGNIKLHQNLRKFAIQNVRNVSSFTSTWITALNAYHLKLPYIGNKSCWNVHKTLNWLLWDAYKSMLVDKTYRSYSFEISKVFRIRWKTSIHEHDFRFNEHKTTLMRVACTRKMLKVKGYPVVSFHFSNFCKTQNFHFFLSQFWKLDTSLHKCKFYLINTTVNVFYRGFISGENNGFEVNK